MNTQMDVFDLFENNIYSDLAKPNLRWPSILLLSRDNEEDTFDFISVVADSAMSAALITFSFAGLPRKAFGLTRRTVSSILSASSSLPSRLLKRARLRRRVQLRRRFVRFPFLNILRDLGDPFEKFLVADALCLQISENFIQQAPTSCRKRPGRSDAL